MKTDIYWNKNRRCVQRALMSTKMSTKLELNLDFQAMSADVYKDFKGGISLQTVGITHLTQCHWKATYLL
jgi:hypothetical protein